MSIQITKSQFVFLLSDQSSSNSAEVTLNALNAGENEVDVEGLADFGNGIYIGKHYHYPIPFIPASHEQPVQCTRQVPRQA